MHPPAATREKSGRRSGGRLGLRLALALCIGTVLIVSAAGFYNLHMQGTHLLSIVHTAGDRIVETIRTSTHNAMLRNEPDELRRIIETIGAQPGIDRIRVLDKHGGIRTSTVASEIGSIVDADAEECVGCHQRDIALSDLERAQRMRIFEGDGGRVMGVIAPIRNEPGCVGSGCHGTLEEQSLLGVLDVRLSLADVDQDLMASRVEMGFGLAGSALAVLVLAIALSWRMVLRPIGRLADAAARVAAGDLTATVPQTSSNEIGELSEAWNTMVREVARSRDRLEASGQELERKVEEKTAELNKAHGRLVIIEKMASLGKLAAVMAHEINNPLAGIGTYAKLLKKRIAADSDEVTSEEGLRDTQRILGLIDAEAMRCGDIVRNLLLFSRSSSASFEPEEIAPLVPRCVMLIRHQAELAEVTIDARVATDMPPIECDASQVEQMILALLVNAVEATGSDGVVTITTSYDDAEEWLVLEVTDTGEGIPPDILPRIFEPFFTTKEEGAGVGLGLAVVYGIVHRHHGRCDVDSTPGMGTTFTVRLPLQQPNETTENNLP